MQQIDSLLNGKIIESFFIVNNKLIKMKKNGIEQFISESSDLSALYQYINIIDEKINQLNDSYIAAKLN